MPGLAIKINFDTPLNTKECLRRISNTYKVSTLKYNEKFLTTQSTFFYSLVPEFIKEDKLGRFINERYIVAIDGDYYNQEELNNQLQLKKISKLETILHLYLRNGKNFANDINGEFVIVIFDLISQKLVICNDRFARRVFYWYKSKNTLALASEKKGIISISNRNFSVDLLGMLEVFTFGHNIKNITFIDKVHYLRPANLLIMTKEKFYIKKYFNWEFSGEYTKKNRKELFEEFHYLLSEAIDKRIKNKNNIILWLSGGYDSRVIAAAIKKNHRNKISLRTIGEEGSEELNIAFEISKKLGYPWKKLIIKDSYLNIVEIGAWRSEFSLSAVSHPFSSLHKLLYPTNKYLISGLPGLDVLNGGHLKLGKIIGSLWGDFSENMFVSYGKSLEYLQQFFQNDFLLKNYYKVKSNFIEELNRYKEYKKLDRWENFNLNNRQPYFSNPSDMVENDIFETLHPFADIKVSEFLRKLSFKERLFQKFSKDYIFKYYPELRNIPYDGGRGNLASNQNLLFLFFKELKIKNKKNNNSLIWDEYSAFVFQKDLIFHLIEDFFSNNSEMNSIFSKEKILKILLDKVLLRKNLVFMGKFLTYIYVYNNLIKNRLISIPTNVEKHFRSLR